jgi:ketosteroid isomerase-like protein
MDAARWIVLFALAAPLSAAGSDEVPLERCDRLPVVTVQVERAKMRFLVDTGATSVLNLKSFPGGVSREISVTSYSGTASARAREVHVPQLQLGGRVLRNLRLPAIDLSSIGEACGRRIDGIFGVDLLEQLRTTLDLERRVLQFRQRSGPEPEVADLTTAMTACRQAFNRQDIAALEECFDPHISLFLGSGEFHGRDDCLAHIRQRYFSQHEHRVDIHHTEVRIVGDTAWSVYEYTHLSPSADPPGRGMMVYRRTDGRWRILSMHDYPQEMTTSAAQP